MSKRQVLILIGVWTIFFLFLGFPGYLDKIFSVIVGLATIVMAYKICPSPKKHEASQLPYVEHRSESGPIISQNGMPLS